MNVFFYKKEDEENFILQYETCPYNNIPRIGEQVIIENKWYLVKNIVNRYKKNDKLYIYRCICLS